MSGYTPASPDRVAPPVEKSQQPDDSDEEILTSVCPDGLQDETVKTFIFKNQGHTLGNVLRDQLLRYPQVKFAGYSMPHPGEKAMHLRVQTIQGSGVSAADMLRKALQDVAAMCDHVEEIFVNELANQNYDMNDLKSQS